MYLFQIAKKLNTRSNRPDLVSRGSQHVGTINCITFSKNTIICPGIRGYLASGSDDRTIKIWDPFSTKVNNVIQTLYGHQGSIHAIADGCDATILSSSLDGTLRIWAIQRGRQMMLYPFFECFVCLNVTPIPSAVTSWYSTILVTSLNGWTCYAGDSNGKRR